MEAEEVRLWRGILRLDLRLPEYLVLSLLIILLIVHATAICAAGGGKQLSKLDKVADTRGMEPGLSKWIADIYNTDYWLYGVLVVFTMAFIGYIIGYATDKLIALLGVNLGKLQRRDE